MQVYISGSLAYDRIMAFPGHFEDHILPQKIHVLNVCFNINGLIEKFGGTAGNIAYTLALLGEKPEIVATAGDDFDRYEQWLKANHISTRWIKRATGVLTAGAYITTDQNDNQITAFNPGAMTVEADLPPLDGSGDGSVVLIGPGNKQDMIRFAEAARIAQVPYVFDPGQSLNIWTGEELARAVPGAAAFISNDYELSLFLEMVRWPQEKLLKQVGVVITTLGPEGSVLNAKGDRSLIPASPARDACDPTGAGDAYRGGLLKGLALGLDWQSCCQMGSVSATFAVEHHGTQEHRFTWSEFEQRYQRQFGPLEVTEQVSAGSGA